MEARYAFRKSQLLDECQMAPEMFEQVIPRLYSFISNSRRAIKPSNHLAIRIAFS